MATTPTPLHPQIVYLPLVDAVDAGASREWQLIQQTEINLLYRVKRALDRAGVACIDIRTKERSKPADSDASHITPMVESGNTDSVEGSDNAQ